MRLCLPLALGLMTVLWLLPARAFELGEPYFETVVEPEAFRDGAVLALAQDSTGLLWIGTSSGVFTFDGYRLRTLGDAGMAPGGLSEANVRDFQVDADDRLWIATLNGLFVHDPRTRRIEAFHPDPARSDSLSSDALWTVAADGAGGLWIGSDGGLDRWRPERDGFEHQQPFSDAKRGGGEAVRSLLRDHRGDLWVGSLQGLFRLPEGSNHLVPMFSETLGEQAIWGLFEAADESLWVGTQTAGALRIDPLRSSVQTLPPSLSAGFDRAWIYAFAEARPGELWIGSYGSGIVVVNTATGKLVRAIHYDPRAGGLAVDYLRDMLIDSSGLLWIGSVGGGLQRHNPTASAFRSLRRSLNHLADQGNANVNVVMEDRNGLIWVGLGGDGINLLDRQRGIIGSFRPNPNDPAALGDGTIVSLALTTNGEMWVGTQQAGLHRFRRDSRNFQRFRLADGLANDSVRRLLPGHSGGLWIGTSAGLSHWSANAQRLDSGRDAQGSIVRARIWALAESAAGRLWAGSASGLFVVEAGEWPRLRSVDAPADGQGGLSSTNVRGLLLDRENRLWVATAAGLDRLQDWDGKVARFESVDAMLGRPGLSLGDNLQQDAQGRIWTSRFVFDPERGHLEEFGRADGVDLGTSWIGAYASTRDGLLLFGGTKGLLLIDPAKYAFKSWRFEPPVIATELQIDGAVQPLPNAGAGTTLDPNQRRFSLEFAALDFSAPDRNRYAYRLEGYDADWIAADPRNRTASYGGLWPGTYTLRVRGSGRMGEWSPRELRVPITVLPAFWQTTWFAALLLFAAWGTAYGAFRWRTVRIHGRARELQALVEQRTAELRSSHDRLQSSNAELETAHAQLRTTHTQLESTHAELAATHGELESTHAELETTHSQLASAHEELATTHSRLVDTQQQLVQQEKMVALGTLTAGVAHEINNPINFADVSAQNLREELERLHRFLVDLAGVDAPAEVLDAFAGRFATLAEMNATTREGLKRIKTIVLDLRAFTRLDEAGRKSVPIAEPIQSTMNLIRTKFDRVRFELDLAFNPSIECEPAKLGQMFMNLIVNACEAIARVDDARKGVVSIQTRAIANDQIEIAVQDNGCGIATTIKERVFEPFFTTKAVGAGTGLGLAIVFGIVKEHGGTIEVESTPGSGTRFQIRLPVG